MENERKDLIKEYYKYSPRDKELLMSIDLDYEKKRLETMSIDELKREVEFYKYTLGWD